MKKVILFLGVLLSFGILSACSNDDEFDNSTNDSSQEDSKDTKKVLNPIEEGDGFAAIFEFFNSEMPFSTYSKSFFVSYPQNENVGEEVCKIINSTKELESIYSGDKDLPEIDFQQYTLVIGQIIMPAGGYKCVKQELVNITRDSSHVLNLYVENIYEYKPCVITPLYFWGLYPKIHLSNITINIEML